MSQSFQGDPQGPGRGAPLGFPCLFSVMDLDLDALPLFGLELFKYCNKLVLGMQHSHLPPESPAKPHGQHPAMRRTPCFEFRERPAAGPGPSLQGFLRHTGWGSGLILLPSLSPDGQFVGRLGRWAVQRKLPAQLSWVWQDLRGSWVLVTVQSLSCVQLFATPWTAARQGSMSISNSRVYSNSGDGLTRFRDTGASTGEGLVSAPGSSPSSCSNTRAVGSQAEAERGRCKAEGLACPAGRTLNQVWV